MSLFQCEKCGCVENTACCNYHVRDSENCTHKEDLGKKLCSACDKPTYPDGTRNGSGVWHNEFDRTFLPIGEFETNGQGDLVHKETGDTNYRKWEIKKMNLSSTQREFTAPIACKTSDGVKIV